MSKIDISVYSFRLKERNKNSYLKFNSEERQLNMSESENQNKTELENILGMFNDKYKEKYNNNDKLEKIFKIEDPNETNSEKRKIEYDEFTNYIFKVNSGKYGMSSTIVNSETNIITYNKGEKEADVMPFYLGISIPNNDSDIGIITFQNNGVYGIKGVFEENLQSVCDTYESKYILEIKSVAPKEYLDRFLENGILNKIRFLRYEIPNNTVNRMGLNLGVNSNNNSYEEYTIHRPIGFLNTWKHRFKEFRNNQIALSNIVELENFEYDNIKMEFNMNGKIKTLDLQNFQTSLIKEDITDYIKIEGGHPERDSMYKVFKENAEIYLSSMGLIIRG